MDSLKSLVRDIPDFPKEGITFKDITPVLSDAVALQKMINTLKERYQDKSIDIVVGIEARGFLFSAALAYALGAGTVMVRKPGKLPFETYCKTYSLEYGEDSVEIHQDALKLGQNVLLVDDVLATGGTMAATVDLVSSNFDVKIIEAAFLMELEFLKGREKLPDVPIFSMLRY
jgi:adenine phosphoribosyltransferase